MQVLEDAIRKLRVGGCLWPIAASGRSLYAGGSSDWDGPQGTGGASFAGLDNREATRRLRAGDPVRAGLGETV